MKAIKEGALMKKEIEEICSKYMPEATIEDCANWRKMVDAIYNLLTTLRQKDKEEIEQLEGENATLREQNLDGCKENKELQARIKDFEGELEEYGQHKINCLLYQPHTGDVPCTCGLTTALKGEG